MGGNGGNITKLRHELFFFISWFLPVPLKSPRLHFLIMPTCKRWLTVFAGQALENWNE